MTILQAVRQSSNALRAQRPRPESWRSVGCITLGGQSWISATTQVYIYRTSDDWTHRERSLDRGHIAWISHTRCQKLKHSERSWTRCGQTFTRWKQRTGGFAKSDHRNREGADSNPRGECTNGTGDQQTRNG